MKKLRCRDAGFDCDHVILADSTELVLQQAALHAKEVHEVDVTEDMAQQISTLITDDDAKQPKI